MQPATARSGAGTARDTNVSSMGKAKQGTRSFLLGNETVAELLWICLSAGGDPKTKAAAVLALNQKPIPSWDELDEWGAAPQQAMRAVLDAVEQPQFVAEWKGSKFLANFMVAHPDRIENIHFGVLLTLEKIPTIEQTCAYGRMYLRAWEKGTAVGRREIRTKVVEDMVRHAMGLSRSDDHYDLGDLNARLFLIMDYFFNECARCRLAAAMVYETMEDLMWPQLEALSFVWRSNAATALFQAYPIESPAMDQQAAKEYLRKQHHVMLSLLNDESQFVRYVAVRGVCEALANYWHLIPEDFRRKFLDSLFSDRTRDGDVRVRQQVFRNFRKLLRKQETTEVLQERLPDLRNNFHDTNGDVRFEFIKLLQAVRERGAFPFFYAVPLDHLTARLREEEVAGNIEGLVRLLLPYFCPLEEPAEVLFRRVFVLFRMNREALWKLFLNSGGILLAEEAAELISCILQSVHEALLENGPPPASRRSRGRGARGRQRRASVVPAEMMKASQPDGAAALLEVVCVLWRTHGAALLEASTSGQDDEEEAADPLATMKRVLPDFMDAYQDTAVAPALEVLCTVVRRPSALEAAKLDLLEATEDDARNKILANINVFKDHDAGAALLSLLSDPFDSVNMRASRRMSRNRSPAPALAMLEWLLESPQYCTELASRHQAEVDALLDMLKNVERLVSTRVQLSKPLSLRGKQHRKDEFLERCILVRLGLLRFAGMAGGGARDRAVARAVELLNWAERYLVPRLPEEASPPAAAAQVAGRPLVVHVLRGVLQTVGKMIAAQLYNEEFLVSSLDFCQLIAVSSWLPFHAYIVEIVVQSLDALRHDRLGGGRGRGRNSEAGADLFRSHLFPLVCSLIDLVPAICTTPRPDGERSAEQVVREAVMVTASLVYQAVLACEMFTLQSPVLSGIIAAAAWGVLEVLLEEMVQDNGNLVALSCLADLPHCCGYLLAPLESTEGRLSLLVQSIMNWRDRTDLRKDTVVTGVLRVLSSGPASRHLGSRAVVMEAIASLEK